MKKTTRIIIMALIAIVVATSGAFAAAKALSFALDTDPGSSTFLVSGERYKVLDMGYEAPWSVTWTGSATISPTDTTATLTGDFDDGTIWTYDSGVDGVSWTNFSRLVGTFSAYAPTMGESVKIDAGPSTIVARYFRVGYKTTLTGVEASASGSGSITVVPEPGAFLALGSGLIGLVGFGIRGRK